jgi:hypothetical protein
MDIHFSLQSPDTVQAKNSIIKKSCAHLPHLRKIHKKNVIFNLISDCYGSISWCSHTVDIRSSEHRCVKCFCINTCNFPFHPFGLIHAYST